MQVFTFWEKPVGYLWTIVIIVTFIFEDESGYRLRGRACSSFFHSGRKIVLADQRKGVPSTRSRQDINLEPSLKPTPMFYKTPMLYKKGAV